MRAFLVVCFSSVFLYFFFFFLHFHPLQTQFGACPSPKVDYSRNIIKNHLINFNQTGGGGEKGRAESIDVYIVLIYGTLYNIELR